MPLAELIPHIANRAQLHFLFPGQQAGEVAIILHGPQLVPRSEQRREQGFLHIADTDDPGGYPVNAGVEEVQPDHHPIDGVAADNFRGDFLQIVVVGNHMVAVPTHGAGNVKGYLIGKQQHGGNLVRHVLGGMEMAVVQQAQNAVFRGIIHIKLVRAYGAGLHTDAKHLGFHCVDHIVGVQLYGIDFVQRFLQAAAGTHPIGGHILVAVGNPDIAQAGGTQLPTKILGDAAASDAVVNPEPAHLLVRMGKSQVIGGHGMGEQGGVKVQTQPPLFGILHPCFKVAGLQLVPVNFFVSDGIAGVEVQPVSAGNVPQGFVQVGHQLFRGAGLTGIVAGGGNAAGSTAGSFKAAYVIPLPAVDGNIQVSQRFHGGFCVDADGCVNFFCRLITGHIWFLLNR